MQVWRRRRRAVARCGPRARRTSCRARPGAIGPSPDSSRSYSYSGAHEFSKSAAAARSWFTRPLGRVSNFLEGFTDTSNSCGGHEGPRSGESHLPAQLKFLNCQTPFIGKFSATQTFRQPFLHLWTPELGLLCRTRAEMGNTPDPQSELQALSTHNLVYLSAQSSLSLGSIIRLQVEFLRDLCRCYYVEADHNTEATEMQ